MILTALLYLITVSYLYIMGGMIFDVEANSNNILLALTFGIWVIPYGVYWLLYKTLIFVWGA